jgi:transposase-like protein
MSSRMVYFVAALTPERPCPHCYATGRFLVDSSKQAQVDYYRCDSCGFVWVLDRSDPAKPPKSVTLMKDSPSE